MTYANVTISCFQFVAHTQTLHTFPVVVRIIQFYFTASPAHLMSSRCIAIYKGTVNDPTTFPPPSRTHGSHHWAFERLLSAALVPLTAAAFVTSGTAYPVIDGLLGMSLVVHSHIGVRTIPFRRACEQRAKP